MSSASFARLRRLRLGPRVFVLIAIPVVGLLIMVGINAASTFSQLNAAEDFEQRVAEAMDRVLIADALSIERCLAAAVELEVASSCSATSLSIAMADTDTTIAEIATRATVGETEISELQEWLRTIRLRNEGLDPSRSADGYRQPIDDLLTRVDPTAAASPDAELAKLLRAFAQSRLAQEAIALQELAMAYPPIAADALRDDIAELRLREQGHFAQFSEFAPQEVWSGHITNALSPAWVAATETRDRLLTDPTLVASVTTSRSSLAAQTATRAGTDVQRRVETIAASARTRLVVTLGTASFLVVAAVLAAIALGRSIRKPLAELRNVLSHLSRGEFVETQTNSTADGDNDEIGELERWLNNFNTMLADLTGQVNAVETRALAGDPTTRIEGRYPGAWGDVADGLNRSLDALESSIDSIAGSRQMHVATNRILADALTSMPVAELANEIKIHLDEIGGTSSCTLIAAAGRAIPAGLAPAIDRRPPIALDVSDGEARSIMHSDTRELLCPIEDADGPVAFLALRFPEAEADGHRELALLADTAARALNQAFRRQVAEHQVAHQRRFDAATGLPNEESLREWIDAAMASPGDEQTSVIIVEVRDLSHTMASRTWDQRNAVLSGVGRRLRSAVGPAAIVARVSTTEFAVSQTGADVDATAARIYEVFGRPVTLGLDVVSIVTAIGYAVDDDLGTSHQLIEAALAACGENARSVDKAPTAYHPTLRAALVRRSDLSRWLDRFMATSEGIEMWLQPIHSLPDRSTVGFEALARGFDGADMISPGEFIPLAEETGRIDAIGTHMLQQALRTVVQLPSVSQFISVNVSPLQLRSDDLVRTIADAFRRSGASPRNIVLEVTESAVVDTEGDMADRLNALRAIGVGIAIDDFGTGYSSLGYLARLPIDVIKLDRVFVAGLGDDESAITVAAHTVELGHELGATIVAEGVETEQQLELLTRLGCDRIQGFLLGRPAPVVDAFSYSQ